MQGKILSSLVTLLCMNFNAVAQDNPYRAPRMEDGHPNFQGMWTISNLTQLERPPGIKSLTISADEAAGMKKNLEALLYDPSRPTDPRDFDDDRVVERLNGDLRSSLIVDPPDGMLPSTELAKELAAGAFAKMAASEGPEHRMVTERCLTGPPATAPMLSMPNANLHRIIQSPGYIVIESEFNHDARIIRMNATHNPANVVSWLGDSTGRWEGETLVVETRHFTPVDPMRTAPFYLYFISAQGVVVERFTMLSDSEMRYVFTVEDPMYYTRKWTGENHLLRTHDLMFEFACHEGNYSLSGILQGARSQEAREAKR
jgi:hypothetical protein